MLNYTAGRGLLEIHHYRDRQAQRQTVLYSRMPNTVQVFELLAPGRYDGGSGV